MFGSPQGEEGVSRKDVFIAFFLLFNSFSWYLMANKVIENAQSGLDLTYTQNLLVWATYYVAIVSSSIFGAFISKRVSRLRILTLWIISGVCISTFPALITDFSLANITVLSALLGISLGFGFPSCLAYFADCTNTENRGKISGIVFLLTNLSAPFLIISIGLLDIQAISILFVAWRTSGLLVLFLKPKITLTSEKRVHASFRSILGQKAVKLYFIAWLMFCLVDRLEKPLVVHSAGDLYNSVLTIAPLIGSISALLGGILADRIGRKRMVIYGFATLGVEYAIISIFPTASFAWYFFLLVGSTSTGILWVLFFLTLWGDLSKSSLREDYYVIGIAPYFLTDIVRLLSAPYVTIILTTSAFSLASFFLFISVLPLIYAPETLSERKMELRQLRKYVEIAQKIKEKHT